MTEMLPDKFTPLARTVVGEAASLIALLQERNLTVGQLFLAHREVLPLSTYDSFAAALTFLYAAGIIDVRGQIVRIL